MKIKYFTRGNTNPQSIFVRVYQSKEFDQTTKTGLIVPKDGFSNPFQKVKNQVAIPNRHQINTKLESLRLHLLKEFNNTIINDQDFHKKWLKQKVDNYFNRVKSNEEHKKYFSDWAIYYNRNETINKKTGTPLAKGTLKKYNTSLNCLKAFEKFKDKRYLIKDIDYEFYKDFLNYCLNIEGYTRNTTGANIKTLKMWLIEANKRGYCNVDPTEFKAITNESISVFLNEDEINKIFEYDFNDNKSLSNARDLLIIGVRTGLRVSDFMRLNINNIKDDMIEIKTKKTGKSVVIPLHSQFKKIIKKNKGKLPRKISDQKFNKHLKEVCKASGITYLVEGSKQNPITKRKETGTYPKYELITSHTCRRSFATNLYGKVHNAVIMGITGHKTEKEFLKYIKVTSKEHANSLKQYWNNQNK